MPERWERELGKLNGVELEEDAVRERVERGPSVNREPHRSRLVAGFVATTITIAAIAFLWRTIPDKEGHSIGGSADAPAPADGLRIRCGPDGIEVLTPVVAPQADGLHIVPVDVPVGWTIGVTSSGDEGTYLSGSDRVDDPFVRPLAPGEAVVMCWPSEVLSGADLDGLQDAGVPFRLVDPSGYFTPYNPDCEDSERLFLNRRADGVDPQDAAERIRDELPGVRPLDVVERAGYPDFGHQYMWRIVREGAIIAGLMVGPQGGGAITGWVCGSSGIDPDTPA
jgi:hypothetical protein